MGLGVKVAANTFEAAKRKSAEIRIAFFIEKLLIEKFDETRMSCA